MKREHFTKHGIHMNGSCKVRTSGLLTSRIIGLLTTNRLGTPITLPWKTETIVEEEQKMKSVVEESNFTGPELIVTGEQEKLSTSLKQDGVKVQKVCFVTANNAEHGTFVK